MSIYETIGSALDLKIPGHIAIQEPIVWHQIPVIDKRNVAPLPAPQPLPIPEPPQENLVPPWMELALSLRGTKETPGSGNTKRIMEWAAKLGGDVKKTYTADSIPWCGLFTGYCLVAAGHNGIQTPLWALSWNQYDKKLSKPCWGCILVFTRNGGGHVGFAVGEDSTYFYVLGGNQSDQVNIAKVAKSRCVGYRWPHGAEHYKRVPLTADMSGEVPEAILKD